MGLWSTLVSCLQTPLCPGDTTSVSRFAFVVSQMFSQLFPRRVRRREKLNFAQKLSFKLIREKCWELQFNNSNSKQRKLERKERKNWFIKVSYPFYARKNFSLHLLLLGLPCVCLQCWRMFNSCLRRFHGVTGGKKGIECQIWVFSLICVWPGPEEKAEQCKTRGH